MSSLFLRRVLLTDALVSGAASVVMIAGAAFLAPLTSLPEALLQIAGLTLVPWFAALFWLARQSEISRTRARSVVAINALWVAGSIAVLFVASPSVFGYAFVIAQAAVVGVFAQLQIIALKREPANA